ncbi:hypothetical protein T01_1986 [Trichinella spiralis]|uniref:Uncharacterized protein n=1 Tax=Trichinella spiralis TaxID=6334 RepID=A0A0V1B5Y4_TRISP|nr:hypothetical protein T01_1986 [Trichinella spiralis]
MVLDLKAKKNLSLRTDFMHYQYYQLCFRLRQSKKTNISLLIAETGKLRINNEELLFPAVSHILRTVLPCQKPNIVGNWKHSNPSYLGTAWSCCASD